MPAAISYIPPTSKDRSDFATDAAYERQRRAKAYKEAVEYYEGKQAQSLEVEDDQKDDNVVVNMVKMTAERTASFLFPSTPRIVIDPKSVEDTPEEEYLKRAIDANGGLTLFYDWAIQGFLAGTTFIAVTAPKQAVLEKASNKNRVYPKISLINPISITIFWKADDIGDVVWYEQRYNVGRVPYIRDYVHNEDGTWSIHTYKNLSATNERSIFELPSPHKSIVPHDSLLEFSGTNWAKIGTTFEHKGSIPPIIETRHLPHPDDRYGLGEFTQKDLQDAINFVMSHRNQIVRTTAEPTDVITGSSADEIESGDHIHAIANANAKITRLEVKGDLAGISDTLDKMVETYLSVGRVVVLKGEASDLQRVTNASIRTLFLDALAKNSVLQAAYGASTADIAKASLEVAFANGMVDAVPDELYPYVRWSEALPKDQLEISQINDIGIRNKYMTRQTAATNLGLDWSFEEPTLESERKQDMAQQEEQLALEKKFQPDPLTKPKPVV